MSGHNKNMNRPGRIKDLKSKKLAAGWPEQVKGGMFGFLKDALGKVHDSTVGRVAKS